MAKIVRHLREGQDEFQKVISNLCNSKSSWQVWSDFVEMTAIAISNTTEIRDKVKQEREERYMAIIGQYGKNEQKLFPDLLEILVGSLERNSEQDFLGEMFMNLELGSHWKGQFFTPYSVCQAMAKISVQDAQNKIAEKGWIAVNDPACGAGATLIAARNQFKLAGIGSSQTFFVGQDIDRTAAMMCYIQLSLLGCAGYVVIADTLCHPVTGPLLWPNLTEDQDAWFMPTNFTNPWWVLRLSRTWRGLDPYDVPTCHENVTATEAEATNMNESVTDVQDIETKVQDAETIVQEVEPLAPPIVIAEPAKEPAPEPVPIPCFMDGDGGQLTLF